MSKPSETVRKIILEAIDPYIETGDSFKLMHEYRLDGRECSMGKDPALSVQRTKDGWIYYCHRCGEQGFIADKDKSPKEVDSMIKRLQEQKPSKVLAAVTLPHDFTPLCKDYESQNMDYRESPIPLKAYHWLWQYNIREEDIDHFNIGWSQGYNRVIIPVYEYAITWNMNHEENIAHKLIGWVGRELDCQTKEERRAKKIAKYLTRKQKKGDRIYFTAFGNKHFGDIFVIVEDIISAIKINRATGTTVIALLTSHLDSDLIKKCQGRNVLIWLDRNMLAKAIGYMTRFKQFGVNISNISTSKDPKVYNEAFIRQQIAANIDLLEG